MVQNRYFCSKSKKKSLTLETNKMSSLTEEDQHQYLLEKSTDEQSFDKTDSMQYSLLIRMKSWLARYIRNQIISIIRIQEQDSPAKVEKAFYCGSCCGVMLNFLLHFYSSQLIILLRVYNLNKIFIIYA